MLICQGYPYLRPESRQSQGVARRIGDILNFVARGGLIAYTSVELSHPCVAGETNSLT